MSERTGHDPGRTGHEPAGSVAATFDELWADARLPMLKLAIMLVDSREAAEDVVQDAFAALHRKLPVAHPRAYLRQCVINRCRAVLRRRRLARLYIPPLSRPAPGADEQVVVSEEHRQVLDAMRSLPRRQREVLVLKYWAGLADDQIAAELGVSLGTVSSSAARGRAAISTVLGGNS